MANGIFGSYQFDPSTFGGGILGLLAQHGMSLPMAQQQGGFPAAPPTDVSAAQRQPGQGVTLPQQDASGFGRDPGQPNPFASLFGGIGDAVGGLFGGGGAQAAPAQPGMQQAPQAAPQGPGALDRLTSAWQGLGHGGLTSALGGLLTGQRQDPQGLLERALVSRGVSPDMAHAGVANPQLLPTLLADLPQQATLHALIQAGVPPAVAQAAALNPEVLKTIAPQLYTKPQLVDLGTDPLTGMKTQGTFNANSGQLTQLTPLQQGGQGGQTPGIPATAQQIFDQIEQGRNSGASTDQLLQAVPNSIREGVRAMLSGGSIPSNMSNRGAARDLTLRFAHAIDPSFDESLIPARVALQKAYQGGGKNFQETQALNTVGGHLSRLMDAADGLGNTGFKPWNWLKNQTTSALTGNPALVKFRNDLVTTQNELAKAYHGGHVSDSAFNAFNNSINEAQTPAELKTAIGELAGLLSSKIQANESGYKAGMNGLPLPSQYKAINDEARHSFDRIGQWVGGQGATAAPAAPGQQQPAQAPTALPAPDAQGWIALPNGIKIREKK